MLITNNPDKVYFGPLESYKGDLRPSLFSTGVNRLLTFILKERLHSRSMARLWLRFKEFIIIPSDLYLYNLNLAIIGLLLS